MGSLRRLRGRRLAAVPAQQACATQRVYTTQRTCATQRTRLTQLCCVGIIVAAIFVVSSCTWVDPFPEYRDRNLILERDLSVDSFAADSITDPGTTFEYVRVTALTAAEYGTTAGLPDDAITTIRRLEAVNLFPDGDFELSVPGDSPPDPNGAAVPLPYWDIDDTTGPPLETPDAFTVDGGDVIQGNSVYYHLIGDQAAALDLDTHALDGFVEPAVYFLSLQFVREFPKSVITFDYGNDSSPLQTTWLDNQSWTVLSRQDNETPVETLPTPGDPLLNKITVFAASGTGSNFFYVGSPRNSNGQSGWVDNIRLGRLDSIPHVALPISASGAEGSLPLVPGAYRVSVYVKSEIDDQVTPGANGANRFRAGQIALGLNDDFTLISRADGGWTMNEWVQVSAVFHVDDRAMDSDNPATVRLTVIHQDNPVVGSVLIAAPALELVSGETTQ
jgi:hypothetical protein